MDDSETEALRENIGNAWSAMLLLRETIETLGPVGAMRSSERVCCAVAPTFEAEAAELVRGIRAIFDARFDDGLNDFGFSRLTQGLDFAAMKAVQASAGKKESA